MERELIEYEKKGDWSGYKLQEKDGGEWIYEQWSKVTGCRTGRKAIIRCPYDLEIKDMDDMDTRYSGWISKAEYLVGCGEEVRCLRRGCIVQ